MVAPEHPHDGYLSVRPPTGLPADGIEGEGWEPPGHRPQNTAAAFSARLMAGVHFNGGSVSAGYDPINNPVNIDSLIEAFPVLHPGFRIGGNVVVDDNGLFIGGRVVYNSADGAFQFEGSVQTGPNGEQDQFITRVNW